MWAHDEDEAVHASPVAAVTQDHMLGVLETRSPKPRCWQRSLPWGLQGACSPCSSLDSAASSPWCPLACAAAPQSLRPSSRGLVSVSSSPEGTCCLCSSPLPSLCWEEPGYFQVRSPSEVRAYLCRGHIHLHPYVEEPGSEPHPCEDTGILEPSEPLLPDVILSLQEWNHHVTVSKLFC